MADFENRLIDRRTSARYRNKGVVDEKEFQQHLKSLPDLADQAEPIEAAMDGEDDLEGDDE